MTKIFISSDEVKVSQNNNVMTLKPHCKPSPLDILETAAAACIALESSKLIKEENLPIQTFKDICVYFSNEKLNIRCKCTNENKEKFIRIVASCYISNKLLFEKNIIFDEPQID